MLLFSPSLDLSMNMSCLVSFYGHSQPLEAFFWLYSRKQLSTWHCWFFFCFTKSFQFDFLFSSIFKLDFWFNWNDKYFDGICWNVLQFIHFFVNLTKMSHNNLIYFTLKFIDAVSTWNRLICKKYIRFSCKMHNNQLWKYLAFARYFQKCEFYLEAFS